MSIDAFGHTDIGRKRKFNEDNYLCIDLSSVLFDKESAPVLIAVADGIGGHAGGDTASAIAVETLQKKVFAHLKESRDGRPDIQRIMEEAIQEANHKIFQDAAEHTELTGMGTTIVTAFIMGDKATICNVGDSRAYLIRKKSITQITHDHSWKAEQRKLKLLSEEEIEESPFKHTITRSLGYQADIEVDTFEEELFDDDFLLLCSDGLYESVPDPMLYKLVKKYKNAEKAAHKLIETANKRSGHDNITAVVAHIHGLKKKRKHEPIPSDTIKLPSVDLDEDFEDRL
jgi:protein phosphatase